MSAGPMKHTTTDRREQAILRLIHRTERMQANGTIASRQFSRWRMGTFLAGAAITIGVYQQAWFHTGNGLLLDLPHWVSHYILVSPAIEIPIASITALVGNQKRQPGSTPTRLATHIRQRTPGS